MKYDFVLNMVGFGFGLGVIIHILTVAIDFAMRQLLKTWRNHLISMKEIDTFQPPKSYDKEEIK